MFTSLITTLGVGGVVAIVVAVKLAIIAWLTFRSTPAVTWCCRAAMLR